ncbi:hypothetical protein ABPG74_012216 [Tetrahymena malaccensis]
MFEVSQIQYDFLIIKKYNDIFWVEYSKYTFPIIFIIFLIKIFKPVDNSKVKNQSEIKRQWHDTWVIPFIAYAPIYYLIDGICLVMTNLAFQEQCKMDMLYHHIVSAVFLPFIFLTKHIPAWQLGPGVMHAMLIVFADYTWLNYPYLVIMIAFNVKLFSQPYTRYIQYKLLKIGMGILYGCLVLLWLHSCSNNTEDLPARVTNVYATQNYQALFSSIDEMGKVIFQKS